MQASPFAKAVGCVLLGLSGLGLPARAALGQEDAVVQKAELSMLRATVKTQVEQIQRLEAENTRLAQEVKRLEESFSKVGVMMTRPSPAASRPAEPPLGTASRSAPPTAWTDLLAGVSLPRDAVQGTWQRTPEGLYTIGKQVRLPAVVQVAFPAGLTEYDLEAILTHQNNDCVGFHFPFGTGKAMATFSSYGKWSYVGPPGAPQTDYLLSPGVRHTVLMKVRAGEIGVLVDGKDVMAYKGGVKAFPLNDDMPVKYGLTVYSTPTTVHSLRVRRPTLTPLAGGTGALASQPTTASQDTGVNGMYDKYKHKYIVSGDTYIRLPKIDDKGRNFIGTLKVGQRLRLPFPRVVRIIGDQEMTVRDIEDAKVWEADQVREILIRGYPTKDLADGQEVGDGKFDIVIVSSVKRGDRTLLLAVPATVVDQGLTKEQFVEMLRRGVDPEKDDKKADEAK